MEKIKEYLDKLKQLIQKIDKRIWIGVIAAIIAVISIYFLYVKVIKVRMYENNVQRIEQSALLVEEGDKYFYQGDYDKAIEIYDSIDIEKIEDGKKTEALKNLSLSKAYYLKGDNENSQKHYEIAENLGCQDEEVINYLTVYKLVIGDTEGAKTIGEEYLKANTQNKELIKILIAANLYDTDKSRAEELLSTYTVDEASAADLAQYSLMNFIMNKDEEGYKYLYDAWRFDKDEIRIYDVLAQLSLFDEKGLIDTLNSKIEENPEEIAYKMWLAKVYSQSINNSTKASELINELKAENTGNIQLKIIEASALKNLDQNEEAEKIINDLVVSNSENYMVNHAAAWYYLNNNDTEKARQYCEKSIEENKDYSDNYSYLMPEILQVEENIVGIDAYFFNARMLEPYNYYFLDGIANYYIMLENGLTIAESYYEEARIMNPEEPEILYNLAIISFNNGDSEGSMDYLKEAIDLNEDNGDYHRMLGSLYLLAAMNDEGIEELRTAYKIDEEDLLTLNNAACYYITYTDDIHRGYYNLLKAYEALNDDVDDYYKEVITENYKKAKGIVDQIEEGAANSKVEVPDFILLF